MLEKIKQLLKHSFIYSISNISIKASGIILLPIYTAYFSVEDYGKLGLIQITIIIISQSLVLGQGLSLIRFNNSSEFNIRKNSILFTLSLLVIFIIAVFVIIGNIFLFQFSSLFGDAGSYSVYFKISIYIVAFITLNNLLLGKLRAEENSILYTSSSILKIILIIGINIYLIIVKKLGIESVLYAQLFGEVLQILIILPNILKQIETKFEFDIIRPSLKYGIPLIFSAMAINLLNGSDRYILKYLSTYTELGLYELGYKVAGILNMFVILPFGLTLLPLAFKIYKTEGDKEYYTKLKTYVAFLLVWVGFSISLFSEEIVLLFALDPSYYSAYKVVPLIVLAYVIYGVSMVSSLGMYLTGKNHFVAIITIFCAGLNIALNFWLIPKYGMMGAAANTVISFAILDGLSNIASRRYYNIPYEHFKIIRLFLFAVLFFVFIGLTSELGFEFRLLLKIISIISFPLFVILLKYFTRNELISINGAIKKWIKPSAWKNVFKNKNTE
jgi:O-antigen/teichoic acid export membrane protein